MNTVTGKKAHHENSELITLLAPCLTAESAIVVVACIPPGNVAFEHSLAAVKFCFRLRESVLKRAQQRRNDKKQALMKQQLRYFERVIEIEETIDVVQLRTWCNQAKQSVSHELSKDNLDAKDRRLW